MLTEYEKQQYRAAEINRKCGVILSNLTMADEMVVKGYPDAQCATLYIECATALNKVREETTDDPNFQEKCLDKIRETCKRAQACKDRIALANKANQAIQEETKEEVKVPKPVAMPAGG